MGGVVIAAVSPARHDDPDRWFRFHHSANLDRRGMGAEHQTVVVVRARKVKGIMLLARRMVRGDVERREVMPVILDVRAFGDAELHFPQDRHHLVDGLALG